MLKTTKIRPINGTSDKEVLSQILSQFAYLIDEVGHQFEVYDKHINQLESRIKTLEGAAESTEN